MDARELANPARISLYQCDKPPSVIFIIIYLTSAHYLHNLTNSAVLHTCHVLLTIAAAPEATAVAMLVPVLGLILQDSPPSSSPSAE